MSVHYTCSFERTGSNYYFGSSYRSFLAWQKIKIKAKKMIIVTQEYHLYRAVYDARAMGIEAYGVAADRHIYPDQTLRNNIRETAARVKDVIYCIFKPKPSYLGDKIPLSGDGNITNDH